MADENDIKLEIKPELTMDDAKKQLKDFEKNIAKVYLSLGKTFQTQLTQISVMMEHFKPILSEIKASGSLLNAQVKKTALKDTDYKKALRTNVATSLDEGIIKGKAFLTKRNTNKEIKLETLRLQKTNQITSGLIQQDNYQSLINQKVENQLNASIAQKKALLENIGLKKEEKKLQEQINKELKDTETKTKKSVSIITQLRRLFAGIYVIKRFMNIFYDMVKLSGDWVENLNLFVVSFGQDFYKESLDWATDFSERLGVSVNEIVKLTANFRQLTSAIGYAQETSDSLSRTLTSLSYDLTSYYNLEDVETAYTKLSSGIFSGQVKTLRSLGIDVSAESITTYLKELSGTYSEFIGITNSGLDQSQKVLARTLLVMKSATNSFGDMSRSIETLANRQRVFQASLENLKLALGDLASDTISTAMAYINGFIRAITAIIRVFKPLKETLDYEVGGTVLGAFNEDAEEAQKNLNKLSFDKFEALTGGDDSKGQLSITEALTKELEKQTELYNEQVKQYSGIDRVAQSVYNSILKWVYPLSVIDEETGKITLDTSKLNEVLESIRGAFTYIWSIVSVVFEVVKSGVQWLLDNNLLDEVLAIVVVIGLVYKLIVSLTAIVGVFSTILTALFSPAGLIVMGIMVIAGLVVLIIQQWENIVSFFQYVGSAICNIFQTVVNFVGNIFQNIANFVGNIFVTVFNVVVNTYIALANILINIWNGVIGVVEGAINSLLNVINFVGNIFGAGLDLKVNFSGVKASKFEFLAYENGGSLNLGTQIWGMNEKGNPEFMFNAGGYDSVINADILEKAIARGTESAIISSGLLASSNQEIVVRGDRIDNDALARAIFPALQKESRRLGGNKL